MRAHPTRLVRLGTQSLDRGKEIGELVGLLERHRHQSCVAVIRNHRGIVAVVEGDGLGTFVGCRCLQRANGSLERGIRDSLIGRSEYEHLGLTCLAETLLDELGRALSLWVVGEAVLRGSRGWSLVLERNGDEKRSADGSTGE